MAQLFRRRSNSIARATLAAIVVLVAASGWVLHAVYWSPWTTRQDNPLPQPVPFSHKHHVQGLGLDCRLCHATVETSAFAGMPSTETCMTCHSQIWKEAPVLAPVRESFATNAPLRWSRVHDTPDFVFFNHSIHVAKGIGCASCHGPVDQMPITWQSHTLYMKWCLDCHRRPEKFIRPRDQVFNPDYEATNQVVLGKQLAADYHIRTGQISDCSMCHR